MELTKVDEKSGNLPLSHIMDGNVLIMHFLNTGLVLSFI